VPLISFHKDKGLAMSSFNKRFVVCAVLFTCSLTSSVLAGQKSGISQAKTISTFSKATGFGTSSSSIGNTMDVSDTEEPTTGGEVTNPTRTCDFSGFPQRDSVNNAYAGGTSSLGASKSNQNIGFTNATVLNTFWGSNEPNQGIVFAPEGFLLVSLSSFSPNQLSFAYTSSVTLTINEFASTNGTGTPITTWTTAKTMPYGPYTVWSTFNTALSANTRSITIAGITDKWGIDQVVVQANSGDCNNNGISDATEIANGTSPDCNGNGIPDSCDIASGFAKDCNLNGVPDSCDLLAHGSPAPGAVQWRVEDGGNGHWYLFDSRRIGWEASKNIAIAMSGYLASITSENENSFIGNYLRSSPNALNIYGYGPFLGGYQTTQGDPCNACSWAWVTNEPWQFTKWYEGEPNDASWAGGSEDYLACLLYTSDAADD
jgi:hypothetical protein